MNARRQQPINYVVLNAIASAVVLLTYLLVSAINTAPSTLLEVGAAPADAESAMSVGSSSVVRTSTVAAATVNPCAAGQLQTSSSDSFSEVLEISGNTKTLSVKAFDSSLGELKSVHVATTIGMDGSGKFTPSATLATPQTLSVAAFVTAKLDSPDGQTDLSVSPGQTITETVGPVNPGQTVDFSFVADFQQGSATPATFTPYTGSAVTFDFTASGIITYVGGANKTVVDISKITASASVTYCYAPPATSDITISKTVEAGAGASVPTFSFKVTCTNGFDGTTTTPGAGSSKLDIGVAPTGTTCTVTEVFATTAEAGRWAPEVNGTCGQAATGVAPGGTVKFNNRLWSSYDKCAPAT